VPLKSLVILGASGNAHDVLDIVEAVNSVEPTWKVTGFLDDNLELGQPFCGYQVLGRLSDASGFSECQFINAIGSVRSHRHRNQLVASAKVPDQRFATLIHPFASVSSRAMLGFGIYIGFGCSIGGGAQIGNHVSLAPGSIVGHDSTVDDFVMFAPGAVVSGFVKIGTNAYLGARSTVRQHQTIGAGALIGMGAVVVHDVDSETNVVGVPARPVKSNSVRHPNNCILQR
jgi:sugar O-acyltransferase (sialic acid O-acetyltransferase NeuD family)